MSRELFLLFLCASGFQENGAVLEPEPEKLSTMENRLHEIESNLKTKLEKLDAKVVSQFAELDLKLENITLEITKNAEEIIKDVLFNCGRSKSFALVDLPFGKFHFSANKSSWMEAKNLCAENGMELASVRSEMQMKQLAEAAPTPTFTDFWVSGWDGGGGEPGQFEWSDGSRVGGELWEAGGEGRPRQPDNFRRGKRTCVYLHVGGRKSGRLFDFNCDAGRNSLCKLHAKC